MPKGVKQTKSHIQAKVRGMKRAWRKKSKKELDAHRENMRAIGLAYWQSMSSRDRRKRSKKIQQGFTQKGRAKNSAVMRERAKQYKKEGKKWGGGGHNKGKSPSKSTRLKISKALTSRIRIGDYTPTLAYANVHKCFFKSKKGGIVECHSRWEVHRAHLLDKCKSVFSYEKDPFRIPYKFKGRNRIYIPDFVIYYSDKIVVEEVKPDAFLKDKNIQAKHKAAKAWCKMHNYKFRVWKSKLLCDELALLLSKLSKRISKKETDYKLWGVE